MSKHSKVVMVEIEWHGKPTAAAFTRKLDTTIQLGRGFFRNRHKMFYSSYRRLNKILGSHRSGTIHAVTSYFIEEKLADD